MKTDTHRCTLLITLVFLLFVLCCIGNELEKALRDIDREDVVKGSMSNTIVVTDESEKGDAMKAIDKYNGL